MKHSQLKELIRKITSKVIKEYSSLMDKTTQDQPEQSVTGNDTISINQLDPTAQRKIEADKEKLRRDTLRAKEMELKTKKKEMEFQQDKLKQLKNFDVPNINKQVQGLKNS